jgi:hypothetical protein
MVFGFNQWTGEKICLAQVEDTAAKTTIVQRIINRTPQASLLLPPGPGAEDKRRQSLIHKM